MSTNIVPIRTASPEPRPFDFNGQSMRVVEKDDGPWFVAYDAAGILGYSVHRLLSPDAVHSVATHGTIGAAVHAGAFKNLEVAA